MINEVKNEIKKLIKDLKISCTIKEFKDKVDWNNISIYQKLSENFIREFKDKVDWYRISQYQKLSENFIKEFEDKVNWYKISIYQKLSENFIREFKDKVDWNYISMCQKLSTNFIKEFKDKVNWNRISTSQKLSINFIKEFKDKVNWDNISQYQKLSENFIREFEDKIDVEIYENVNEKKSYTQKLKEVKEYCKTYELKLDKQNKCFYAFREHDKYGRGVFNKTIFYKKHKYYRDWHCDMRKNIKNSFGLGIWPKGNTKVKILINDWGVEANREDGKARVWGFEIVK